MASNVIGIYDNSFNQLFLNTNFLKVSVDDSSQTFAHPLEDGSPLIDYTIDNPIEISMSIILSGNDYIGTYKALKKVKDERQLLTIQTKTDVYNNMMIYTLPYDEDAEVYDGIKLTISMIQANFEVAETGRIVQPRYPKDANSTNRGNVQSTEVPTEKRQSVLRSLF